MYFETLFLVRPNGSVKLYGDWGEANSNEWNAKSDYFETGAVFLNIEMETGYDHTYSEV